MNSRFPVPIAWGNVDSAGLVDPGDIGSKVQGSQGCTVVFAGDGLLEVTLDPEYQGIPSTDLMCWHNGGWGSTPGQLGTVTGLTSISNGVFLITTARQDTVPPELAQLPVHFMIFRMYQGT